MIKNIKESTIIAKIEDKKFELPEEIRRKIEEFWKQCILQNPNLWNGELMCVGECKKEGDQILITCKKSDYAHYLYDERIGLPKKFACSSLVAGCLLETSDNYYIVGELADNTSFPHCMQISGGSADNNDIKDGKIDVLNTIVRECKEELNIDLQDSKQVKHYEIKYLSLPTEEVHTYIIFAKGKLDMTKNQMQEYYEQYLKYLKENNLEVEFEKVHFIKKGRTTKELENFQKPKRNYLKSLLEIDSKDNTNELVSTEKEYEDR